MATGGANFDGNNGGRLDIYLEDLIGDSGMGLSIREYLLGLEPSDGLNLVSFYSNFSRNFDLPHVLMAVGSSLNGNSYWESARRLNMQNPLLDIPITYQDIDLLLHTNPEIPRDELRDKVYGFFDRHHSVCFDLTSGTPMGKKIELSLDESSVLDNPIDRDCLGVKTFLYNGTSLNFIYGRKSESVLTIDQKIEKDSLGGRPFCVLSRRDFD